MQRFWMLLLRRAMDGLLNGCWTEIQRLVLELTYSELPGEEKRRLVFRQCRVLGMTASTWLIHTAIEIAYGLLQEKK